jgi:hypothetical protein
LTREDFISAEMCFIGRTAGHTLLESKRNEEIMGEPQLIKNRIYRIQSKLESAY